MSEAAGIAWQTRVADLAARFGLIVVMVLIIALFSILRPDTYFTLLNF